MPPKRTKQRDIPNDAAGESGKGRQTRAAAAKAKEKIKEIQQGRKRKSSVDVNAPKAPKKPRTDKTGKAITASKKDKKGLTSTLDEGTAIAPPSPEPTVEPPAGPWVAPNTILEDPPAVQQDWDFAGVQASRDVRGRLLSLQGAMPQASRASMLPSPPITIDRSSRRRHINLAKRKSEFFQFSKASAGIQYLWQSIERDQYEEASATFENLEENAAVIAYPRPNTANNAIGFAITTINSNSRLCEHTQQEDESHTNALDIYLVNSNEEGAEDGFFLDIQELQTITVNGQHLRNTREGETLLVGPLDAFTVLEWNGVPFFFWRHRRDAQYDIELPNASGHMLGGSPSSSFPKYTLDNEVHLSPITDPVTGGGETGGSEIGDGPPCDTQLPDDGEEFNSPCHRYHSRMVTLLGSSEVKKHMEEVQATREGAHLLDEEPTLAISSVIGAINQAFPSSSGFAMVATQTLTSMTSVLNEVTAEKAKTAEEILTTLGVILPNPVGIRRGMPMILPLIYRQHIVLLVVEYLGQAISIKVVDSRSWLHKRARRDQILTFAHAIIAHTGWNVRNLELPQTVFWVRGPQQHEDWACGYSVILNAWALALGLELDCFFRPRDTKRIYSEARKMTMLARGGFLDWSLIYAFLRCHGYIGSDQRVPVDRRFQQTQRDEDSHDEYLQTIAVEELGSEAVQPVYIHIPLPAGTAHDQAFATDRWDNEAHLYAHELLKAGILDLDENVEDLKYRSESRQESGVIDPCHTFRDLMKDLRDKHRHNLNGKTAHTKNALMKTSNVLAYISSVTQAVTQSLNVDDGLSCIVATSLGPRAHDGDLQFVARRQRPLILPLSCPSVQNHIVLVIAQINESGDGIDISILDSQIWRTHRTARVGTFENARDLLSWSTWADLSRFPLPDHALWIPCAQQTDDGLGGLYAVLNAWALALDLELNVDFTPRDSFLQDAYDLIRLGPPGILDWRTISTFLRCAGFVNSDSMVPTERQFDRTLCNLKPDENRRRVGDLIRQEMAGYNPGQSRITLPRNGWRHDKHYPSDVWDDIVRDNISHILRDTWINPALTNEQMRGLCEPPESSESSESSEQSGSSSGSSSPGSSSPGSSSPGSSSPGSSSSDSDESSEPTPDFKKMREHFEANYPNEYPDIQRHSDQEVSRLHQDKFGFLLPDSTTTQSLLSHVSSIPCEWVPIQLAGRETQRLKLVEEEDDEAPTYILTNTHPDTGERQWAMSADAFLTDDDVNYAIASVTEAIERHRTPQDPQHRSAFALWTTVSLSLARSGTSFGTVPRPRRCWLVPVVMDQEHTQNLLSKDPTKANLAEQRLDSHTFLVVLQEEVDEHDQHSFVGYFLDSVPEHYPANLRQRIYREQIQELATVSLWTQLDSTIRWREYTLIPVAPQTNEWACGIHTILNAWVCALGLRVNPAAQLTPPFYDAVYPLINCALAGLLDWMTIVAFLECHEFVMGGSLCNVPQDRQFAFTQRQSTEAAFEARLERMRDQDDLLLSDGMDGLSYDRSTNVDFRRWLRVDIAEGPDDGQDDSDEDMEA